MNQMLGKHFRMDGNYDDDCNGNSNNKGCGRIKKTNAKHKSGTSGNSIAHRNNDSNNNSEKQKPIEMRQPKSRSHWCLADANVDVSSFYSLNYSAIINSNFAFNRIIFIFGFLLFVMHATINTVSAEFVRVQQQQQQQPLNTRMSDIFSVHKTHHIIQPTIYDGKNERQPLKSTRQTNGEHAQHIILEYKHLGKRIVADLYLNTHLLAENYFLRYQNANGSNVIKKFGRNNVHLCHYHGHMRNNRQSRIALSTCDGINGIIYDGNETYFIHPNANGALHEPHYLFSQNQMRGNESNAINAESIYERSNEMLFEKKKFKRSVAASPLREPYNANKLSSFVELVIVIDNEIYKEMNENLDKVHKYCKDIANIINSLYVPLNIFIALVGVVVWTTNNEIELSNDGDATLKNFLNYRRKVLIKDHPNDNAQLLTKQQFDGGVVGKALKGPICTYEFSGGVSMDHSPLVSVVATTIAHEMGHNFGMEHDTPDCKCPDERCIMSASSSSIAPLHWSECSIDQLNLAIHQGMNHCLRNRPKKLFDPPVCGNGFVELGEDCDCGLPNFCKNSCCDPFTCKLRSNATCATGKCCDFTTCQPHAAGFECRSIDGECDLPEYCNGESEFCPMDYFKRDTEKCDGGKAFCYNGACKTRDNQCKLLWGPSGKSSEQCYEKNMDGTRHGNCGYDRVSNTYKSCAKEDIFCGMLQCRHLNERLEFGMESVAVLSHSFISYGGSIVPCRTAIVDLGLETMDPGLTPDGSKCDEGKMCINQTCVAVEMLQKTGKVKDCPDNCNGHGVCDNIGHCHCDKGFAPPFCDAPGPGGSLHSGPATDPNDGYGIARVMYVFFLGVVPFISLSLFLLYYWRQNRPWFITQTPINELKTSARHLPDRPAPPAPPSAAAPLSHISPNSTDDMSATLLRPHKNNSDDLLKRDLFGNFKGFSLKPLPMTKPSIIGASNVAYVHPVAKKPETIDPRAAHCMPIRSAPLPPSNSQKKVNASRAQQQLMVSSAPKLSSTSFGYQNLNTSDTNVKTHAEVKLFATKANETKERPKISSPVLENSTCSVKELISAANSTSNQVHQNFLDRPQLPIAISTSTTITNNASVKTNEPMTKKPTIADKKSLKSLEISAPIKTVTFGRSQSMRSPSSESGPPKRNVLASGSMRHPSGAKRPISIVDRPKNPPPPRPPNPPLSAVPTKNRVLNVRAHDYDDCESSSPPDPISSMENSTDNIYCVIEDLKPAKAPSPPKGLLSEIVNEIESRNIHSIYSTSKNQRKNTNETHNALQQNLHYQNIDQTSECEGGTKNTLLSNNQRSNNAVKLTNGALPTSDASSNTNSNIYMNTSAPMPTIATIPLSSLSMVSDKKVKNLNMPSSRTATAAAHDQILNSLGNGNGKQTSVSTVKPKPTIATKPTTAGLFEPNNKNSVVAAGNKESSQKIVEAPKKPTYGASRYNKTNGTSKSINNKATITPSSNVLALHKKFESHIDTPRAAKPNKK